MQFDGSEGRSFITRSRVGGPYIDCPVEHDTIDGGDKESTELMEGLLTLVFWLATISNWQN